MTNSKAVERAWIRDMERRNLAPPTIRRRVSCVRLLTEGAGPPLELETEAIQDFLDRRGLAVRTRYAWISHLHCFYRWAIDAGHATHDPTVGIARPRMPRLLPRPIASDELRRALDQSTGEMRTWLLLAAYEGLRCAEIAGLEAQDVSDTALRIRGKGGHERLVPLHPEVRAALPGRARGPLFVSPAGRPYHPARVSRLIRLHLEALSIDATAHQLRHWFGTAVYAQSQDLRSTQELLGHASPTTTAAYVAWSPQGAAAAVSRLSA